MRTMNFLGAASIAVVALIPVAAKSQILDQYDQLCVSRGEGDGQALVKCKAREVGSARAIMLWLGSKGLLKDGKIDFQKINGATDPKTPSGIAASCFLRTGDWINLAACFQSLSTDFKAPP